MSYDWNAPRRRDDLTAPYRATPEQRVARIEAADRIAARQHETSDATKADKRVKRKAARANLFWMALPFVIVAGVCYGVWTYAIEPMVHYHSVSVACAAGVRNACSELTRY